MTDTREAAIKATQAVNTENWQHPYETASPRAFQVYEFHELYNCPVHRESPTRGMDHMSDGRIAMRLGLIVEEVKELLLDGFGIDMEVKFSVLDKEMHTCNLTQAMMASGKRDLVSAADALGDISYVVDGFALEAGIPLDEVISEIHFSNCTKLGDDGKPIYRSDGKVLKGPLYTKPDVQSILKVE